MINGRKSGRSRGRRKICCGAAALASCLPLCLTAAEAGEYSEVSTHQTITEETHNTEKTRFAVTDKEQNRGGALLLEAPYYLAGGSVFEGTQAAESGGAVYADSKGRIRGEGPLTFRATTPETEVPFIWKPQKTTSSPPALLSLETEAMAAAVLSISQTDPFWK